MKIAGIGSTCLIPVPYLSGLKLVRDALQNARFSILGEVDLFEGLGGDAGVTSHLCRVLYIDSPVLLLETLILDRAAAVFLPCMFSFARIDERHVFTGSIRRQSSARVRHLVPPFPFTNCRRGCLRLSCRWPEV